MNTTQIPNNLFDEEMFRMKDTELRVVMLVLRKTLGWTEDKDTGMRKHEDWISSEQLIKLTGRKTTAVSQALRHCITNGWVEARNKNGELLDTPDKRLRVGRSGKIFYRLGGTFLGSPVKRVIKPEVKKLKEVKDKPLKRKEFRLPRETYKEIADAYEKYKGVKLTGAEYGEINRAIKTMLYSGRTQQNIIDFMKFCAWVDQEITGGNEQLEKSLGWLQNWTMLTIKRKMPEFLANKFRGMASEEVRVPGYAKWCNK